MIFLGLNYDISRNVCTSVYVCVGGIIASLYWVIPSYLAPCVCFCVCLFLFLSHMITLSTNTHVQYIFTSAVFTALHQREKIDQWTTDIQIQRWVRARKREMMRVQDKRGKQTQSHTHSQIPGGCEFRSGITTTTALIFMSVSRISCSRQLILPVFCEN